MDDDTSYGRLAYEGYAERTGGKTYDGRDMPSWGDLGGGIQAAWEMAAWAVLRASQEELDG